VHDRILLDPAAERAHLEHFGRDSALWENHGWCLRLHGEGREYLLWVAFYIIRAGTSDRFVVQDVRIDQAVVVAADAPAEGAPATMRNNEFTVEGVHWSEYLGPDGLSITEPADAEVRWASARRVHTSGAEGWQVVGAAGDLHLDLRLTPWCAPFDFTGFDLILGFEALARVEGTVTEGGRSVQVTGFGQHEKVHTAMPIQRSDNAGWNTLSEPLRHVWHVGAGERLAFSRLANQPGEAADKSNCHVVVDGRPIRIGSGRVSSVETGRWTDPQCGVDVATAWSIDVQAADGTFKCEVAGTQRAYYLWDYLRGRTSLLYWELCAGTASWRGADGERIDEPIRYVAHTNRPFLRWG
jgi:hypothetical protein